MAFDKNFTTCMYFHCVKRHYGDRCREPILKNKRRGRYLVHTYGVILGWDAAAADVCTSYREFSTMSGLRRSWMDAEADKTSMEGLLCHCHVGILRLGIQFAAHRAWLGSGPRLWNVMSVLDLFHD